MHKPDGIVTLADFMKIVNSVDGPKKFRLQKVDRCSFKHILNPVDRDCKYELIIAVCKLNDGTECHAIGLNRLRKEAYSTNCSYEKVVPLNEVKERLGVTSIVGAYSVHNIAKEMRIENNNKNKRKHKHSKKKRKNKKSKRKRH